jgi:hypothetical protein
VLAAWADGRTVERALRKADGVPIAEARPAIERALVRILKQY